MGNKCLNIHAMSSYMEQIDKSSNDQFLFIQDQFTEDSPDPAVREKIQDVTPETAPEVYGDTPLLTTDEETQQFLDDVLNVDGDVTADSTGDESVDDNTDSSATDPEGTDNTDTSTDNTDTTTDNTDTTADDTEVPDNVDTGADNVDDGQVFATVDTAKATSLPSTTVQATSLP